MSVTALSLFPREGGGNFFNFLIDSENKNTYYDLMDGESFSFHFNQNQQLENT